MDFDLSIAIGIITTSMTILIFESFFFLFLDGDFPPVLSIVYIFSCKWF